MKGIRGSRGFTAFAGYGAPYAQPSDSKRVTIFLRREDGTERAFQVTRKTADEIARAFALLPHGALADAEFDDQF